VPSSGPSWYLALPPDDSRIGPNIRGFPAFLQDRTEVMDTSALDSRQNVQDIGAESEMRRREFIALMLEARARQARQNSGQFCAGMSCSLGMKARC
jgi:hypothetical protein